MRIGGRKCRSWRLKKKYNKWFDWCIEDLLKSTIEAITPGELEKMSSYQGYDFTRLWRHVK
ncbi:hypothetical protein LCGC14_0343040 [marine sediment metagenome]|uniref:Uncharacterized protein n=1 Tax=marine sediment metagenome TaxID=412755 RepID=A0A0F9W0D5_9ZZZZ